MSADPTRRHARIAITEAEAARMVAAALPGHRVRALAPVAGGRINTNWRVSLADGAAPVLLRLYARGPDAAHKERALAALVGSAVPVPAILGGDPTGDRFGAPYAVARWLPGITLDAMLATATADEAAAAGAAVGRTLAAIGRYRFDRAGFFAPGPGLAVDPASPDLFGDPWCYMRGHFAGPAGARLGTRRIAALESRFRRWEAACTALGADRTLVHADFKGDNLLVDRGPGGWRVTGVLDWEWAHVGTPLFDAGILLRREESLPAPFAPAFAAAYVGAGGALPPGWRAIARLIDLNNLVERLGTAALDPSSEADCLAVIDGAIAALTDPAQAGSTSAPG